MHFDLTDDGTGDARVATTPYEGPVATLDVVRHLMAIRSPRGAFVTRRMRRFLSKTAPTAGWTHGDDVSMAAVALEG